MRFLDPQVGVLKFFDTIVAPVSTADPSLFRIGTQLFYQDSAGNLWPLIPGADSAGVTTVTAAMSPYVVQPTDRYLLVDTSGGPVQVNLPASPVGVNPLQFADAKRSFNTNPLTISGNGHNVNGAATLVVSAQDACPLLLWSGPTWETSAAVAVPFNPAAPGPVGGTTPGSGAFSGLTAPSLTTPASSSPLSLSSTPVDGAGVYAVQILSNTTFATPGAALLELSNHNGSSSVGNWFYGAVSGGQSDALCDGMVLTASGAISDGAVVVWTGAKNTVAQAVASGNLLTIAGVAIGAASGGKVRVAKRGLCYVNAVAGTAGATLLVTSGTTAGAVATGAAAIGALVGRSLETVGGTVAGKLLCELILG